jgi:Mycolic acid cyclopropane synthetase
MIAVQRLRSLFDPQHAAQLCRELLATADVTVGGDRPWDMQIHDDRFYERVLRDGTLAVGESYVEGWWDSHALDQTVDHLMRARLGEAVSENWLLVAHAVRARVTNLQSKELSFDNGQRHYDIGNDLYAAMLDRRLLYTCAYWPNATTLDEAQEAKLDLVCKKIGLRAGMRVLDLGCGWGGFAAFAAERYGATVTGYTVSTIALRRGATTPSCRSASWSTSAARITAATWSSSIARSRPAASRSSTPSARTVHAHTSSRGSTSTSSRTRCCRR